MANKVQHYRSYETGTTPATLLPGELAVNFPDKRMWFGDAAGVPVEFVLGEEGGPFLSLNGGTMDGHINMGDYGEIQAARMMTSLPGVNLFLRNGGPADGGAMLRLSSDEMNVFYSSLNMNAALITNVLDPVNPQDAATKAYVDAGDAVLQAKVDTLETQLADAMVLITALQTKVDAL